MYYARSIQNYLDGKVDITTAKYIETVMRWNNGGVLDHLSKGQFEREARMALSDLNYHKQSDKWASMKSLLDASI